MGGIAFIVNPIAGGKDKKHFVRSIKQAFSPAEGYNTEVQYTQQGGDAQRLAAEFVRQGFTQIIAVGGDGTVNEVGSALSRTNAAMGIIPYGSGNGLARHLGIPLMPSMALAHIKRAQRRTIDGCAINDTPFFCTAGVGFDAMISSKFAQGGKRGAISYIMHIIREFKGYTADTYRLTIDGATTIERKAFLVAFANASQWGNNAYIAPCADISDGTMDVVIINDFALYQLPLMSGKLLITKNINTDSSIDTFRCRSVVLERDNEGYIHYDGEPAIMGKRIEVQIFPKTLDVLC